MPRLPRLHVPGGIYHVMLRGNHHSDIFWCNADRRVLSDIVALVIEVLGARIHSFCWMTNHIHLALQVGRHPLGRIIQRIAIRYARHAHRQLGTTGHLFEQHFKAKLVDADSYVLSLLRYIHLNPVEAGIVHKAEDYPWSSHRAYLGLQTIPWLTTDYFLSFFGNSADTARRRYASLVSGRLYASELRLLEDTHPEDKRVLGGDRFLAELPKLHFIPRSAITLDQLAREICESHGITLEKLRSPSRQRLLSKSRAALARRAVSERVANLRQVADFLGRDPSTISGLLTHYGY